MRKLALLLLASICFIYLFAQKEKSPVTKKSLTDTTNKYPFKPWKDVLKETRVIKGFILSHLKRDNTLYFELDPKYLDKDFGMVLHYSHGPSEMAPTGLPAVWETRLMRFHRFGDQVALINYNEKYTAPNGSPIKAALNVGIGHSIVAMFKIESENKENKHVLIDVTTFFASDYINNSQGLKYFFDNKPVSFEKEKSFVEKITGFEKNTEIDATISYRSTENPSWPLDMVSDPRYISVGLRYSLFALPEQPMRPRFADDRVGHFITALWDYSRDKESTPFVRYVNRWRLEKKNPLQAVSEPVQPIVFYIHNSIPNEYRKYVREGIEGWNKAFDKSGFENAIIARSQPEDSSWSAEDIRYSTIRWIPDPWGWAIGPSQVDPRTGEILNADILIASGIVNFYNQEYQNMSGPQSMILKMEEREAMQKAMHPGKSQHLCMAQMGFQHQLNFQNIMLTASGIIGPGQLAPENYIGDAIRALVYHEVGHTLGLRHNFKASSGIPYEKLNDSAFTREHGLTLSVMDYSPVNVANDPKHQGDYWNKEVGTYDVWAIQYAYTPIYEKSSDISFAANSKIIETAVNELPGLNKIALKSNEPLHTYGTDEDNWLGPFAVDPLTNAFELSSNPLQFAKDRVNLVNTMIPLLDNRLIIEGEGYNRLRNAFSFLLFEKHRSVLSITKMVGGLYFNRNHKGDPNEYQTFTPVPAAIQRDAVATISAQVFAENAFTLSPQLLNKLAPNRYSHWGMVWGSTPVDFPYLQDVNFLQTRILEDLLHPVRLQRMLNNEMRTPAGETNLVASELMQTLTKNIWTELNNGSNSVSSIRMNLQRSYTNQLVRLFIEIPAFMVWSNNPPYGLVENRVPEHARSLARLELTELTTQINKALKSNTINRDTRAHLEETRARIEKALAASHTLPLK